MSDNDEMSDREGNLSRLDLVDRQKLSELLSDVFDESDAMAGSASPDEGEELRRRNALLRRTIEFLLGKP